MGFIHHLGGHYRHHYLYDPFYCDYHVGYGWNHYHWGSHYCHPLNYGTWWYPTSYTYCPPTYIYVNDHGDYSPYPSTVVINTEPTETVPAETVVSAGKPTAKASVETLIARHLTLGDFYFKEGRYTEASESYLRALAYAPEDASIHFVLADALFALGDYHYAAFIIKKALRLDPAMAHAEADKRTFYKDAKELDKHMATIKSYLDEKPYDAAALLVFAHNLKLLKEKKLANDVFERVLKINPEDAAAKLFLEALEPKKEAPKGDEKKDVEAPANSTPKATKTPIAPVKKNN